MTMSRGIQGNCGAMLRPWIPVAAMSHVRSVDYTSVEHKWLGESGVVRSFGHQQFYRPMRAALESGRES